jgi:hypothetical protein
MIARCVGKSQRLPAAPEHAFRIARRARTPTPHEGAFAHATTPLGDLDAELGRELATLAPSRPSAESFRGRALVISQH